MEQPASRDAGQSSQSDKSKKRKFQKHFPKRKRAGGEQHASEASTEKTTHPSREHHVERLEARMSGFVVTCSRGNERRCVLDSYSLLNTFYESFFPDGSEKATESGQQTEPANASPQTDKAADSSYEHIYVSEQTAVAELTASFAQRRSRFQSLNTNVKQCVFIMTSIEDTVSFLHHSLATLALIKDGEGACRTRFVERMLPCVGSCSAKLDALRQLCEEKLTAYFSPTAAWCKNGTPPATFEIIYKARNTGDAFTRDEVIYCIGDVMKKVAPNVKVDLRNPDVTISLDVFCKVCCLCVCPEYNKFKRYNIHGLTQPQNSDGKAVSQQSTRPAESDAEVSQGKGDGD